MAEDRRGSRGARPRQGPPARRPAAGREPAPGRPTAPRPTGSTATTSSANRSRPGPDRSRAAANRTRPAAGRAPRTGRTPLRLRVALVVVCLVCSLYAGKLFQIQALESTALAQEALDSRLRTSELLAHRGDVVDRHGQVLASTVEKRHITVDQTLVATYVDPEDPRRAGPRAAAARLAPVLGLDVETLTERLDGDARFAYVVKDIEPEVYRAVAELRIVGLFSEQASRRTYPSGQVAAGVLGFVGDEGHGLGGLEMSLDDELGGEDGYLRYEVSGESRSSRPIPGGATEEKAPVDGADVVLSLDRDLQWMAEDALTEAVRTSGAESATAIAMRVDTGELLVMANAPGFDPNDPGDADADDRGNRAVGEAFEPGSTSKVITVAAALEEGVVSPETPFEVADTIVRGGTRFKDSHPHALQQLTTAGVLAESSNVGTILAGEALDNEQLHAWFEAFGYGRSTGLGLPGETPGLLADPQDWSGSQRYTVMFGQGVSVNSVQIASVFQTIANDGVRVEPSVVVGTRQGEDDVTPEPTGEAERVLTSETAASMRTMLESAVSGETGTGSNAIVPGYRVAGKTGTAQRYDEACGGYCGYTASFVGFAPAEDPEVVVAVMVQDPVRGIFGGTTAAPVFQQIMSAALAAEGVPASEGEPRPYPLTW
ncbi:penicillin-binding transpeptidase domain-containing protein [Jannaschia sp. R86511]|uniref:peptidoglycan D,D-transpeptidase FtsI family protein n=1 Tax=Jannaschia sp. R86511 TaxID=3093853 RepID=UPI0036D236E2